MNQINNLEIEYLILEEIKETIENHILLDIYKKSLE